VEEDEEVWSPSSPSDLRRRSGVEAETVGVVE